jgi:anti-sigma factor RsiW
MTTMPQRPCEDIRLAGQALLDGEPSAVTPAEIQAHTAGCEECRAALAGLAAMHAALGRVDYEALDLELWPAVRPQIAHDRPRGVTTEARAILGLSGVLIAWRLAQLLLDVPAPVINSVVPLTAVVLVLWWIAGDPFAVQPSLTPVQQKGSR